MEKLQTANLNPRELNRLTENNIHPCILQVGTKIEICLRRNGSSSMDFGQRKEDLPKSVGIFTLGLEVPIIVDLSYKARDIWEIYLEPTSEVFLRARRVLDKLESAKGMTEENQRLCRDGLRYVEEAALDEIETKLLRDTPDLANTMTKLGLSTIGFDFVFHLKS